CCWSEIIRTVHSLFVKIQMELWHPLIIKFNPLLGFLLCLPCPVPVEVKKIMVGPPPWPWLIVFNRLRIRLKAGIHFLVVPINVSVSAIRVNTGIYYDQVILEPCFGV